VVVWLTCRIIHVDAFDWGAGTEDGAIKVDVARDNAEEGSLKLGSIGMGAILLIVLFCNACTSNRNKASPEQVEKTESPNTIALSLGDSLATLHYLILVGADSETARRYKEVTAQSVRDQAAKLEIEVPPEELSASYDPHANEIIQRIDRTKGRLSATIFTFAYHAQYASWVAVALSRPTGYGQRPAFEESMLSLHMNIHARDAVRASRLLPLPDESLRKGDAIESQLRELSESSGEGRPEDFKRIGDGISSLHSSVKLWVYLIPIQPEKRAERRPSRSWILFLAIALAANLLLAVVAFFFPQRESLLIAFHVVSFACGGTSGFMFGSAMGAAFGGLVFGALIGGSVFAVIPLFLQHVAEYSAIRQRRIARLVVSHRDADRLWAVSNIHMDKKSVALLHKSLVKDSNLEVRCSAAGRVVGGIKSDAKGRALLHKCVLNDPEPQVREKVARLLARHGRFWELMETLESASEDANSKEGVDARALYRKMGGDLLTKEWQEVYSQLKRRNAEGQRTPVTVKSSHTKRWTEHTSDTIIEHTDEYYTLIVPPICCLCGLNYGDVKLPFAISLSLGFCRLCSNVINGLKPVEVEGYSKGKSGESVATMSFLNDKVADLFRRANDKT
jgi:hypothetical protein